MIRVDVQLYCSECCDFEPDITKPTRVYMDDSFLGNGVVTKTDTIIRCSHAKRCEAIKRYLEHQSNTSKG